MIEYIFRPIDKWPREFTKERRKNSPFDTTFDKTIRQLTGEAERMGARNVVIQLALDFGQIRRDGLPYADAQPNHPGVIVAFEGKHGPVKLRVLGEERARRRASGLANHNTRESRLSAIG